MEFCPYMSNFEKKVECSPDCIFYISKENSWKVHGDEYGDKCIQIIQAVVTTKLLGQFKFSEFKQLHVKHTGSLN